MTQHTSTSRRISYTHRCVRPWLSAPTNDSMSRQRFVPLHPSTVPAFQCECRGHRRRRRVGAGNTEKQARSADTGADKGGTTYLGVDDVINSGGTVCRWAGSVTAKAQLGTEDDLERSQLCSVACDDAPRA